MAQHTNNYPKLHNAAWPGLVGKGPDSEPPIDLDTMIDLTAARQRRRREVRRDGPVPVRPAHLDRHRRRRPQEARRQVPAEEPRDRLGRRARLAADGRRQRDGRRSRAQEVRRAGPQGLQDRREAAPAGRPPVRRRPHRLGLRPRRLGEGPRGQPEEDRRDVPPGRATSPKATASGSPPRARSAGAACTRGGGWCSCSRWSTAPRPSASRPTWPTRCSTRWATTPPKTRILPQNYDWKDKAKLDEALKKLTAALRPWTIDFHVAQNNAHGPRLRLARQDRPPLPRHRPDRQARHPRARRLLARRTRAATRSKRFRHICWDGCMFPNETMMKPQTWNDILGVMVKVRDQHGWQEAK